MKDKKHSNTDMVLSTRTQYVHRKGRTVGGRSEIELPEQYSSHFVPAVNLTDF